MAGHPPGDRIRRYLRLMERDWALIKREWAREKVKVLMEAAFQRMMGVPFEARELTVEEKAEVIAKEKAAAMEEVDKLRKVIPAAEAETFTVNSGPTIVIESAVMEGVGHVEPEKVAIAVMDAPLPPEGEEELVVWGVCPNPKLMVATRGNGEKVSFHRGPRSWRIGQKFMARRGGPAGQPVYTPV